ncbi:MAG: nucleoside phosphorylase [Thermoproteota archaeon]|jgi:uridine phosphorylase|nr:nucleoside phosphorylase [Thermoproteota archaeon]
MSLNYGIKLGKGRPRVEPQYFISNLEFPNKAILVFTNTMVNAIKKLTKPIDEIKYPSNYPYRVMYKDAKLSVLGPCYGAPATIVAFEIAIAHKINKFIIVGEAAAIDPRVKLTDLVLPIWGIREEGTSYHYKPPDYIPKLNNYIQNELINTIKERGYENKLHIGGVWSIDAFFRETEDKIEEYRNKGILCLDMESTALMTVADYRNVDIAILLVISDLLYGEKWISSWRTEELRVMEEEAVHIALETIYKL